MHQTDIIKFFESRGWTLDRFGHLRKDLEMRKTTGEIELVPWRIKLQATSLRVERQIQVSGYDGKSKNEWLRVTSTYYKDIVTLEDGRLKVGTKIFK